MTKQKSFQRSTTLFLSLIIIGLFAIVTSCNNDDHSVYPVTHKVVYKAEGSAGINITSAEYNDEPGSADFIIVKNINSNVWASPEITSVISVGVGKPLAVDAVLRINATGADDSSTLKVQIYVDGVLKKEVVTTGVDLKTETKYNIEYKID